MIRGRRMTVAQLKRKMDSRFDRVEGRLDHLEGRFDLLEGRFDRLERRFDVLEGRFDVLEGRFDRLEGRFDTLEGRFDDMSRGTNAHFALIERHLEKFGATLERIATRVEAIYGTVSGLSDRPN